ncbi:MAG: hypothetical protein O7G83_21555 [Proteobacteria bacterium]|nr:hypothetical protein [Pseudomonadota bacterium]
MRVTSTRDLNASLHDLPQDCVKRWRIINPNGAHSLAVGLTQPVEILIEGVVGYYCGGMNKAAKIEIDGHCGWGVAENIMSGRVWVRGNASQSAGASGHGGLLVIDGDASARCGISLKGADIVIGQSVGHMSGFMAQEGRIVVCGDAGGDLGDSIYETRIYVGGSVESLGADCIEKELTPDDHTALADLLQAAGRDDDPGKFRCFGSARQLYNFDIDNAAAY